jgi:hypothetical protein
MLDVLSYLPARRKKTASGWISCNAPCCVHNGESQDRRQRGGIKTAADGWTWHCFNCGFTASFRLGRSLSVKARRFLAWLNVPQEEIERVNLESLRHRSMEGLLAERQTVWNRLAEIEFEETNLPPNVQVITAESFPDRWQYLLDRGVPRDFPCLVQAPHNSRPHVIVPFTHDGQIVGHTTRFLDDRKPKYIMETQSDYVFGWDLQRPNWQHVLVMEGVFDALSIGGMAVLHADISDGQARLIRGLGRDVTVVPDHDQAGMRLVERALELGWAVSIPDWEPGIKDVNDAVARYGKLGTLLSIMHSRETSRIKIELRRKNFVAKLRN